MDGSTQTISNLPPWRSHKISCITTQLFLHFHHLKHEIGYLNNIKHLYTKIILHSKPHLRSFSDAKVSQERQMSICQSVFVLPRLLGLKNQT